MPEAKIYVELMQNRRAFPQEMHAGTPHIKEVPILQKMLSSTFFAVRGLL